ncbi:DUF6476 family protein [Chachezhania sediminis]|uniref:DUF6476 family protein n=1 Tax=Chachezhania sediminis TaxID=2599291 RepID=UPI002D7F8F91|nr:DUF6476 family protein [Chachezhania sediminis]
MSDIDKGQGLAPQDKPARDPHDDWADADKAYLGPEAASLRFLRRLVTTLTAVMVIGLVILIGLFITRFPRGGTALPDQIKLPDGARATAFTVGSTWYAVVTADDRILIFDRKSGNLTQTIAVETAAD